MITQKPAVRRLIVNADDFGLTDGVNRAVLELHAAGALTSATVMATAPAFRDAAHAAFAQTSLGVGCHVVLSDGHPQLHAADLPTLAPGGRLRDNLHRFTLDLLAGRIAEEEIEREAVAQIRRAQSAGVRISHIDTHKHTHIFPRVLRPVLRAARVCNVTAIRNPFEPAWSLRLTRNAPPLRSAQVRMLRLFRRHFLRAVHAAGMHTTDGALGVLATGSFDRPFVERLLARMPPGTWELVCHPGYLDDALRASHTRLLSTREVERSALLEAFARSPAEASAIELIHFADLSD